MITFSDVSFAYTGGQRTDGVSHIDLTIPQGQVVLLCGASGCGKSTMTRLINGLAPHYYEGQLSGAVNVTGLDVASAEIFELALRVGSVFQNPRSQFFTVDTDSELVFGCENYGMEETEILSRKQRTISEFGIENLMGRSIFRLSGGEKQKIACASVSSLSPDILVLDEPSSNLDAAGIEDLRRVLLLWKKQGKTVVIAKHRLYYLRDVVDRVVYLQGGRVHRDLPAQELQDMPREEYAALGLRPFDIEAHRIPARADRVSEPEQQWIELTDLRYVYRKEEPVLALDGLRLPLGRITAVVGSNGAGKSTFAQAVCGLIKNPGMMASGSEKWTWKTRLKKCFMVAQDVNHQLFGESVVDELLLSQPVEDVQAANEILDRFGLLPLKDRHPMSLSGGEKQRVAIASAIASERPVIILDEPTSGLDLGHMREVAAAMRKLTEPGRTVIVVTHDPELILTSCDYVLHLAEGRATESYPLDDVGQARVVAFFEEKASNPRISDPEFPR